MQEGLPSSLALIAGKGAYPLLLAESAKAQGVERVVAIAFRGETDRAIEQVADAVHWVYLGQLSRMLDELRKCPASHAVMAGQITPTHLFRVRMDAKMLALLKRLPKRNAETIFGAVGEEMKAVGVALLPAHLFMEKHMPGPGLLTKAAPTEVARADIALGRTVAKATSALDIGQTVVIKEGTVLAVEAFEGTDAAIRRAAKLGGAGIVVVKVAKQGHDMRFDIPVVGERTLRVLRKAKASALAIEAGRTILLEKEKLVAMADACGLAMIAVDAES